MGHEILLECIDSIERPERLPQWEYLFVGNGILLDGPQDVLIRREFDQKAIDLAKC